MDWLESGERLVPGNHHATVSNIMNGITVNPLLSPPLK